MLEEVFHFLKVQMSTYKKIVLLIFVCKTIYWKLIEIREK